MNQYINQLNEAQRQAVVQKEGPMIIIAGAGSGKTRVLTYRIAHLMKSGVDPFNILSLTFTNKAAREMKNRIAQVVGQSEAKKLWMGTFHSVFARILRSESDKLGFPSNFTIYDTQDSVRLISSIIKEMHLEKEKYKPKQVLGRISQLKNSLITVRAYYQNPELIESDKMTGRPKIGSIYKEYVERCFKAGAMDFDDLLLRTNELLTRFPEVLAKYQDRFRYILVDEYQDTNHSQYLIVRALADRYQNICVVGDDSQSIYAFRGANIQNILNFKKDYDNVKMFKLEQNYRSSKNIVEAANSVIDKNKTKLDKDIWTSNDEGGMVKVMCTVSEGEEGRFVANSIFDHKMQDQMHNEDFTVLYRTNSQSRAIEDSLRKKGIDYRIYGGLSFYQRKEIKDLLAYFKLTVNKQDDEALTRIINYPKRGIGKTSIDKLIGFARENDISIWEAIKQIQSVNMGLNSRAVSQIFAFANLISEFTSKIPEKDAYALGKEIAATSGILKELFADKAPEAIARHENVQELLNGIKQFADSEETGEDKYLNHYLESVALLTNEDNEKEEDKNKVTLMTIHSAKGLEFRNVYVVGVEERLFPSEMASFSPKEIEEERRLFYVAVTRAEKELIISYSRQRYRWGQLHDCTPSRFIKDIDKTYIEFLSAFNDSIEDIGATKEQQNLFRGRKKYPKKKIDSVSQKQSTETVAKPNFNKKLTKIEDTTSEPATNIEDIKAGIKVKHARFGIGTVISVEGEFPNAKAVIYFNSAGKKNLLLKFAKLQVVS